MTDRRCANWLERYIEIGKISESPDYLHLWAGISILSGICQRKVYFDMGTFEFIPNFYIIFVAPPGITAKSTAIAPVQSFLSQFKDKGVHLSKASTTWQELIQHFAASTNKVLYPGEFGALHYNTMSIVASELGTFLDFSNKDLINHLTELWDAKKGKFEKGTKTQGSDVLLNPVLNMIGGTTPAWVEENFQEFMVGSGFASRCIFIHAKEKARHIAYPWELAEQLNFDVKKWKDDLLFDLQHISKIRGSFTLSAKGLEYGKELYVEIQDTLLGDELNQDLRGFYARKQGHIHKLAMMLSVASSDELVIDKETLEKASLIIDEAEKSRLETLSEVGKTRESKIVGSIRNSLQHKPLIYIQELWAKYGDRADTRTLENAILMGAKAGYWEYLPSGNGFNARIRKKGE